MATGSSCWKKKLNYVFLLKNIQKQPFEDVFQKSCFHKVRSIHKKTPVKTHVKYIFCMAIHVLSNPINFSPAIVILIFEICWYKQRNIFPGSEDEFLFQYFLL